MHRRWERDKREVIACGWCEEGNNLKQMEPRFMLQISLQCHARARLNFVFILHLGCGVLISCSDHVTCTGPFHNYRTRFLRNLSQNSFQKTVYSHHLCLRRRRCRCMPFVFFVLNSFIFFSTSHWFFLVTYWKRQGRQHRLSSV